MVRACAAMVVMLVSNACELVVDDGPWSVESSDARDEVTQPGPLTPPDAAPDAVDAIGAAATADAAVRAPESASADSAAGAPDVSSCPPVACAATASACAQTCATNMMSCMSQCSDPGCEKQCPKQASAYMSACMGTCTSCMAAPACPMNVKNVCPMAMPTMPAG